jgi:hypothetical protein
MQQSQFNPMPGTSSPETARMTSSGARRQMLWLLGAFLCGVMFGAYLVARDYKLAGVLVLGHTLISFALFSAANSTRDRRAGASSSRVGLLLLTALSFAGGAGAGAHLASSRFVWPGILAFGLLAALAPLTQLRLL